MADISSITLPNGDVYNFKDAVARATAGQPLYGYCTTAAATQAKAVDIPNVTALTEGLKVTVRFQYAQTYNGMPTLNVNSLGAKNILLRDGTNGVRYLWQAGSVIDFTYNGTGWVMENGNIATTTYYGLTKLSSATNSTSTSLAATASAVKAAYDLANQASSSSIIKYSVAQIPANADAIRQNAESLMASSSTGKPMVLSNLVVGMSQYTIPYTSLEFNDSSNPTEQYVIFKGFTFDDQIITVKITYTYNASTSVATYDSYAITTENSNEIFVATYGTTTCAELEAAYQAGKTVICKDSGNQIYASLRRVSATDFHFSGVLVVPVGSAFRNQIIYARNNADTWSTNTALMAPMASPALSGTPTAPTAAAGTNTTQIATTAFVKTAIDNAIADAIGGSY